MTLRQQSPRRPTGLAWLLSIALLAGCARLLDTDTPGALLFQDDFSRTSSGWDRYADSTYISDYAEGTYRIAIQSAQTEAWANPDFAVDDVRIEVDAASVNGPLDNAFGVLCRYQDPDNYYFFLISGDGYAGIGLTKDGRRVLLTGDAMLPADPILQGYRTNHIRADCNGFELSLYVNGVLVDEAQASEWPSGDVGLLAATYAEPGIDIRFDNFTLLRP
ncbi:MAG TPA: hypothetical protein VLD63_06615 [Anaerolineales bacterium]|nr:hypothetical protein [Anaerolineales bacterium]